MTEQRVPDIQRPNGFSPQRRHWRLCSSRKGQIEEETNAGSGKWSLTEQRGLANCRTKTEGNPGDRCGAEPWRMTRQMAPGSSFRIQRGPIHCLTGWNVEKTVPREF